MCNWNVSGVSEEFRAVFYGIMSGGGLFGATTNNKKGRKKNADTLCPLSWDCLFNHTYRGSYTVEMSLLFPIILFVIMLLIYIGLFVHNRAVVEEAVKESVLSGTLMGNCDLQQVKVKTEQKYTEIINGRLLGIKDNNLTVEADVLKVKVSAHHQMKDWDFLGAWTSYLFHRSITVQEEASFIQPEKIIRLVNRFKDTS